MNSWHLKIFPVFVLQCGPQSGGAEERSSFPTMELLLSAVRSTKHFDEQDIASIKTKLSNGLPLTLDNEELTDEALEKLGFKHMRNQH